VKKSNAWYYYLLIKVIQ